MSAGASPPRKGRPRPLQLRESVRPCGFGDSLCCPGSRLGDAELLVLSGTQNQEHPQEATLRSKAALPGPHNGVTLPRPVPRAPRPAVRLETGREERTPVPESPWPRGPRAVDGGRVTEWRWRRSRRTARSLKDRSRTCGICPPLSPWAPLVSVRRVLTREEALFSHDRSIKTKGVRANGNRERNSQSPTPGAR